MWENVYYKTSRPLWVFRCLLMSQKSLFLYTWLFLKVTTFLLINYTSIFEIWFYLYIWTYSRFFCFLSGYFWTGILVCMCWADFTKDLTSTSPLKLVLWLWCDPCGSSRLWGVLLMTATACQVEISVSSGSRVDFYQLLNEVFGCRREISSHSSLRAALVRLFWCRKRCSPGEGSSD